MSRLQPINKKQILIGSIALFIGLVFYLIGRPPDHTYFIYKGIIPISLYQNFPIEFGFAGDGLPAFLHVFSFSMITAGWLSCGKRSALIICLSWFTVDCMFELGQIRDAWSSRMVPDWFVNVPFIQNLDGYFINGTFDFYDMISILIGAVTSYLVLMATKTKKTI